MNKKSNKFPAEWSLPRLSEISKINGLAINPKKQYAEKYFFYIDIDSIENETGKIKHTKKIDIGNAPSRARRVVKHNDVIISTVRPYLKAFAIIPKENDNHICSTGFTVLSPYKSIDSKYLLYILFSRYIINQCKKMMVGAQYPALNDSQVRRIEIPLPPLPEQKKIAEILTTVDEAIEKVDGAIQKAERLKKGLMQTLLTRGIGHKKYKKTKIGLIPKDWEIINLPEVFEIIDGDRGVNYPSSSELHGEGYCLFLNAKNVTNEGLKFIKNRFINKEKDIKLRKGKLMRRDIVITTRGTVGNVGLYNYDVTFKHMRINSGMAIFRFKNNNNYIDFYYYLLQSNIFQKQIKRISYGSAQHQLSVQLLKKLKIFQIEKNEQKKIAEILSTADQKLELMRERKCKLNRVKKGLMNDLLTGRKRVRLDG